MYLQPHYDNGVFGNVYLSARQHYKVNIASAPLVWAIPNLSSCLLLEHQTYLAGYIQLWYVVYTLMAPCPSRSHFFALCSRLAVM